jgi:hypothetical protein
VVTARVEATVPQAQVAVAAATVRVEGRPQGTVGAGGGLECLLQEWECLRE